MIKLRNAGGRQRVAEANLLPLGDPLRRTGPVHPAFKLISTRQYLVGRRLLVVHRVSSSLLGPVDFSFRALSGRLKFTVRRHKLNKDSLFRVEGLQGYLALKKRHPLGPL